MGYLTHKEKSLLFSALTREEKVCKENGFEELVPVVKSLEGKFYYDRFEKEIRNKAINEFAKRLKTDYVNFELYYIFQDSEFADDNTSLKYYQKMIDEIAEELKTAKGSKQSFPKHDYDFDALEKELGL